MVGGRKRVQGSVEARPALFCPALPCPARSCRYVDCLSISCSCAQKPKILSGRRPSSPNLSLSPHSIRIYLRRVCLCRPCSCQDFR